MIIAFPICLMSQVFAELQQERRPINSSSLANWLQSAALYCSARPPLTASSVSHHFFRRRLGLFFPGGFGEKCYACHHNEVMRFALYLCAAANSDPYGR